MIKNKYVLQITTIVFVLILFLLKPPTNYILILFLIQGFAFFYYGLHLINRSHNEKFGETFLGNLFTPNHPEKKGINLKRFGIIIVIAGLVQIFAYLYMSFK